MGGQYAALEGRQDAAKALEEFYFPLTSTSPLPSTEEGNIVSLAGKIDTLVGNFLIGQIPTGSEDPFALRRQAFGAVRMLLERVCKFRLKNWWKIGLFISRRNGGQGLKRIAEFSVPAFGLSA